ncbi:unnamed protein product [Zymoseptoria tritici ST99CH_1A5]|uniref:CBM1 domain-containing protein n=3 Tax=Zymoseptoria tritici TaxID=1047171 RepID=A0A1X7RH67_ZYMT9|nr:unnamed protein product [Zymoseptoria tritici ST99CH_3D7]SMR42701.1 unnamed protein product [Zymoseptoria tritici ST99CH_1E4]SMY20040.1 unnamed protein product [Zymoseptoria tritici ST99CH_1A5]
MQISQLATVVILTMASTVLADGNCTIDGKPHGACWFNWRNPKEVQVILACNEHSPCVQPGAWCQVDAEVPQQAKCKDVTE